MQQPSNPGDPNKELEQRIQSLIERTAHTTPRTRRLLKHLSAIEEALARGVSRAELANTFDCSLRQFAAGLAGARRLHKRGGDGRLASHRKQAATASGHFTSSPRLASTGDDTLIKEL